MQLGALMTDDDAFSRIFQELDLSQWMNNGFWITKTALDRSTVANIKQRINQILNDETETVRKGIRDFKAYRETEGELLIIDNIHWSDTMIASIVESRNLGKIAARLLNTEIVRLWGSQLILKKPTVTLSNFIRWHRDIDFWKCVDQPKLITAWIALDDMQETNGPLEYAIGSHKLYRQKQDYSVQKVLVNAGQMALHHCRTLHRSGCNMTLNPRAAIAVHLMDGNLRYIPGSSSDFHMNVALNRGRPNAKFDSSYFPILYEHCETT